MYHITPNDACSHQFGSAYTFCFTYNEISSILATHGLKPTKPPANGEQFDSSNINAKLISVSKLSMNIPAMVVVVPSFPVSLDDFPFASEYVSLCYDVRKYLFECSLIDYGYQLSYGQKNVFKYSDVNDSLLGLPLCIIPGIEHLAREDIVLMGGQLTAEYSFFSSLGSNGHQQWAYILGVEGGFLIADRPRDEPENEDDSQPSFIPTVKPAWPLDNPTLRNLETCSLIVSNLSSTSNASNNHELSASLIDLSLLIASLTKEYLTCSHDQSHWD